MKHEPHRHNRINSVYVLLDPRKGPVKLSYWKFEAEPFYVGRSRSTDLRLEQHRFASSKNPLKDAIIKKIDKLGLQPIMLVIKSGLSIQEANSLEMRLIRLLGTRMDQTGPLSNLTLGGDGGLGRKVSAAQRNRVIELNRQRWLPSHLKSIRPWSRVFDYASDYRGRHRACKYVCKIHGSVTQIPSEATHAVLNNRTPCPECGKIIRGLNISRAKRGLDLVQQSPGRHLQLMKKLLNVE